jgi:hypothetical protein
MEVFTKKIIPILIILLTLFSIIPSFALAEDLNVPPSSGSGDSVDQMKTRMTESLNNTIETLENSKENLTNESSLEAAEQLTTSLKAMKENISSAETEDDLLQIKQKLDASLAAAPDDIKIILPQNMGPGPGMQNRTENLSQGFENDSERRPEMTTNRSQPPKDENATMEGSGMPGKGPEDMEEKGNLTDENGKETADGSGFFGKLVSALKSLFS